MNNKEFNTPLNNINNNNKQSNNLVKELMVFTKQILQMC